MLPRVLFVYALIIFLPAIIDARYYAQIAARRARRHATREDVLSPAVLPCPLPTPPIHRIFSPPSRPFSHLRFPCVPFRLFDCHVSISFFHGC